MMYWGPIHCVSIFELGRTIFRMVESWSHLPLAQQQVFTWLMNIATFPSDSLNVLSVLEWVSTRDCKDDRDRIYSILGLPYSNKFPWWNAWIQKRSPDYSIPVSSLFLDIATTAMNSGDMVHILNSVHHGVELERWKSSAEPSWVPRWNKFSASAFNAYLLTTKSPNPVLVLGFSLQGRALNLRGMHINEIAIFSKTSLHDADSDGITGAIYDFWRQFREDNDSEGTSIHSLNMAICSLVYDTSGDQWRGRDAMSFHALKACVQKVKQERACTASNSHKIMFDSFHRSLQCAKEVANRSEQPKGYNVCDAVYGGRYMQGRQLFRTKAGLTGVGPQAMREEDVVFTLGNSDVSLVIRAEGSFFRFVGLAAMLPQEWRDARNQALRSGTKLREIEIR
jgi:hypothetical protein